MKNCVRKMMKLYLVTDKTWAIKQSLVAQVQQALEGGVTCVQYREKNSNDVDVSEAEEIKDLCHKYNVPFIVNDDILLAKHLGADGVHIGQDDTSLREAREMLGNDFIIGVSVHNVSEALKAVSDGADYLGVGAMFATNTKTDAELVSLEELSQIRKAVQVPIVAIGGISSENLVSLSPANIDGIAVVSAILASSDIKEATLQLKELTEKMLTQINNS